MVTEQVLPLVESHPVQEVKPEPVFPVAVRTTDVPYPYVSVQSEPQLIPLPVTEPVPVPDLDTERVRWVKVKAALTDLLAVMVTVHEVPLLESQPVQPEKVEPVLAAAVMVTEVL